MPKDRPLSDASRKPNTNDSQDSPSSPSPPVPPIPEVPPDYPPIRHNNQISVWGIPYSGKTVSLLAFTRVLRNQLISGYNIYYPQEVSPDTSTIQFSELVSNFVDGRLAPRSDIKVNPFSLNVQRADKTLYNLSVIDGAGELSIADGELTREYWQQMRQSKGILFFIDEMSEDYKKLYPRASNYATVIDLLHRKLNIGTDKFPGYAAICITKADDRKKNIHNPQIDRPNIPDLMRSIMGESVGHFRSLFHKDRMRIFVTSAVGWYQSRGEWKPNILSNGDGYTIDNNQLWRPYNVATAIFWLFDQIDKSQPNKEIPKQPPTRWEWFRSQWGSKVEAPSIKSNLDILNQQFIQKNMSYRP